MKVYMVFICIPTQTMFDYTIFHRIYHQPDLQKKSLFYQDHDVTKFLYGYSTTKELAKEFMKQRDDIFAFFESDISKKDFAIFEESYDAHKIEWNILWTKNNITCSVLSTSFEFSYIQYDMLYDEVLHFEMIEDTVDPEIFLPEITKSIEAIGYSYIMDIFSYGDSYDALSEVLQIDQLAYFVKAFGNTFERRTTRNEVL